MHIELLFIVVTGDNYLAFSRKQFFKATIYSNFCTYQVIYKVANRPRQRFMVVQESREEKGNSKKLEEIEITRE